ncbi:hypothetical protein QBC38DRAFT_21541 [Podospora fimiseda]|uniref:Uncharacterized protein n=1 Tax=Podospora fimiseda TaxID=252190 RepID=A0AAN7H723_9PEZI|nr:hypothetical protein QBC38DRAFT_21541 [Podospora fimiseda]
MLGFSREVRDVQASLDEDDVQKEEENDVLEEKKRAEDTAQPEWHGGVRRNGKPPTERGGDPPFIIRRCGGRCEAVGQAPEGARGEGRGEIPMSHVLAPYPCCCPSQLRTYLCHPCTVPKVSVCVSPHPSGSRFMAHSFLSIVTTMDMSLQSSFCQPTRDGIICKRCGTRTALGIRVAVLSLRWRGEAIVFSAVWQPGRHVVGPRAGPVLVERRGKDRIPPRNKRHEKK